MARIRGGMRRLLLVGFTLTFVFLGALSGTAQAEGSLQVLNESLDLSLESSSQGDSQKDTIKECDPENGESTSSYPGELTTYTKTAKATIFVFNSSNQDLTNLDFCAEVEAEQIGQGTTGSVPVIISPDNRSIGPYDTEPFRLMMETDVPLSDWSDRPWLSRQLNTVWWEMVHVFSPDAPSEWSNPSGYLTVLAEGDITPGTVSLQLDNPAPSNSRLLTHIVIVSTLFFFLVWGILLTGNSGELQEDPGQKEPFDFKKSWVSALTTAGVFLGTSLTAGVLPTDTFFLSKAQYTALNVLFGLIVVVAVLIHNAGTKGSTLVFAAALTLGSACGELVTVLFVFREMAIQETMPWAIVLVIQLLLIVVSAVLTFIAIQRVTGALGSQEEVSVIP